MEKLTVGIKQAAFLAGLDQLMNKAWLCLAGSVLLLLVLARLPEWILPPETQIFLVPAVAIISIVAAFLFNYAGLIVALAANFSATALLYNRWAATGEEAIPVIIALLIYSTLGALIISFFKGKEETHRQNLEWISTIDCLTEIYNHRYFQQRLTEEYARSKRSKTPLALLFIDLDNFKTFNDQNGHLLGDRVLKKTASFLKKEVRIHDIVCRYGGDEFVIILPDTDAEEAGLLAKRLVKTFNMQKLPGRPGTRVRLSMSIGTSSYPDRSSDIKELAQHADHALYLAKEAGKNKTRVYGNDHPEDKGKTKSAKTSFSYKACKHALISNCRAMMNGPKEKYDNTIIIGIALSIGHTGFDDSTLLSCGSKNVKVKVH